MLMISKGTLPDAHWSQVHLTARRYHLHYRGRLSTGRMEVHFTRHGG